jgi:hypothetical protein
VEKQLVEDDISGSPGAIDSSYDHYNTSFHSDLKEYQTAPPYANVVNKTPHTLFAGVAAEMGCT